VSLSLDQSVLVVAALRLEALALRRGAPHLRVERSGMGATRAQRAAARLAADPAPALVVAGVCGALDTRLEVGDVVVASDLRTTDGGLRPLEPDSLYEALADLGLRVRVAPLLSTERLVLGPGRMRLADSGARAVDMESWWLAEAAGSRPFGVVRVVSDGPNDELLRPATVARGLRALRVLSALAPGLQRWGAAVAPVAPAHPPTPRAFHAIL